MSCPPPSQTNRRPTHQVLLTNATTTMALYKKHIVEHFIRVKIHYLCDAALPHQPYRMLLYLISLMQCCSILSALYNAACLLGIMQCFFASSALCDVALPPRSYVILRWTFQYWQRLIDTLFWNAPFLVEEDVTLVFGVLVEADGSTNSWRASEIVARTSLVVVGFFFFVVVLFFPL